MNPMDHLTSFLQSLWQPMEELFFPSVCLHCQEYLLQPADLPALCEACFQSLKPISSEVLQHNVLHRLNPCYIDDIYTAFQFNDVVQSLIHAIKYQQMPNLGRKVGKYVATLLVSQLSLHPEDKIIPVPLHSTRKREREYNQSLEIARGLFEQQLNQIDIEILIRERYTLSQTRLTREERRINVENAFRVTRPSQVSGKRFLLIDDVITTGSTMNECARVLKSHGATHITAISIAAPVRAD